MSIFEVGDKIRRTGATLECLNNHKVLTVKELSHGGAWLGVEEYSSPTGDKTPFLASKFELVQTSAEQPVLTPQEVFTAILEGVPLEYRVVSRHTRSRWFALKNPKRLNLEEIDCSEFRKQVQTVTLSGTVPKPVPYDSIEITDTVYTVYFSTMKVAVLIGKYAQAGGLYWRTRAQAEQFRDALTECFSTVPVLD